MIRFNRRSSFPWLGYVTVISYLGSFEYLLALILQYLYSDYLDVYYELIKLEKYENVHVLISWAWKLLYFVVAALLTLYNVHFIIDT